MDNLETRTTEINGETWSCNPFMGTTGVGYLKRLFKVFGQSFSVLVSQEDGEVGMGRAIDLLVENLDKDDVVDLVKKLCSGVMKDGKVINFDTEFAARYDVLIKVVTFVVKENFGSFFQNSGIVNV